MGALIALDYAIAYPDKIDKLVLINAPMVTNEKALEEAIAQSSSRLVAAMTFNKKFGRLACMLHKKLPMIITP